MNSGWGCMGRTGSWLAGREVGREGMGRRHAAYKMVAMVLGTNIVRKELGLPEAECLAAEQRYSLTKSV